MSEELQLVVREGEQYIFDGLSAASNNGVVCSVFLVNDNGGKAVFRHITKTGLVSKNKLKEFSLTFEEIEECGQQLESDEYRFPDLPKNLSGVFDQCEKEGLDVVDGRKRQIITLFEEHLQTKTELKAELEHEIDTINDMIEKYQEGMNEADEVDSDEEDNDVENDDVEEDDEDEDLEEETE